MMSLHLITLCLGLIIAYGLLQLVELFRRRRRQRDEAAAQAAKRSHKSSGPPPPPISAP